MTILGRLDDAELRREFDVLTLHRGRLYAAEGRVGRVQVLRDTDVDARVQGFVQGTQAAPYVVQLDVEDVGGDLWLGTFCTCPVHHDCKHGAAVALTVCRQAAPAPAPPSWRVALSGLAAELDDPPTRGAPTPLALEVSLIEPTRHASWYERDDRASVGVRPLRLGARGRWVKTGADWGDLQAAGARGAHPAGQVEPLLDLVGALKTSGGYWYPGTLPTVDQFGARVVTLMRRAVDAGVALLPRAPLTEIVLHAEPVTVVADLARGEHGATTVVVGLDHGGRLWRGPDVLPAGSPVTVVGLLDEGVLTLASTGRRLPGRAVALVTRDQPLVVPEGEDAALAETLAPLARLLTLRSSDGSVAVPEPVRPRLRLTVAWASATEAGLTWSWHYVDRSCSLDSRDPLDGLRDRATEDTILERVPPGLVGAPRVTDGDALAFAIHDLPALGQIDDVEVVEESAPDFRESTAAPSITFTVAQDQPTDTTDWLDLAVSITVEGESVPLPGVLASLTRGDDFLVLPSGLYLKADRPELQRLREVVAAAAELRAAADADDAVVSVGKHDLGVWAELGRLGIVDAEAAAWVQRAQALADLTELPRPEPVGLTTTLRSYQREGFHWLAFLWQHRLGGILADDMGLGKTIQVLALVQHAVSSDAPGPFLVVAPTSVVSAWTREAARHTPGLRVARATRTADDVSALAATADVVVTTYAVLRLAQERFAAVPWAGVVLDEAQQIKNHKSKTYAAVRRLEAPFRLAVTGTPFENRLMELWSLLSVTAPGIYPWPRSFTAQVVNPVERDGDAGALARLRRRIRPFMLRRTKEMVAADLPAKQEQVLEIELTPRHRKLYDAHQAREQQRILGLLDDFDSNRVAILAALTVLRRAALDVGLLDADHDDVASSKLEVLVEHLREVTEEGHQALVFSQFTSYLARVEDRLTAAGVATTYLDGATADRDAAIARFRSGSAPVFLISLKAGGVGLTLTEADYVFVLDPWWNPAAEAQAVDRAHRIGQTRPVHVYRLIAADTIEEKVMHLKARKAELFAQVVDGDGAPAGGLTAADVRALFE